MTLENLLLLFGIGFLVANLRVGLDFVRFLRRRSSALLVWPARKPPFYGLLIAIGVALGVLLLYNLAFLRLDASQLFGEAMMFLYYAYAVPLSRRIRRGFYADGIWAETGFLPYDEIGGVSWREGGEITLLLISRIRNMARRLIVPAELYGAARRLLRDKVAANDIKFAGTGLNLGEDSDRRDSI